jgi:predicted HD phosphohydrolase
MAFTSLATATPEDWRRIIAREDAMPYGQRVASHLLMLLREQRDDDAFGMPINGYQHCLQTATRVLSVGEPPEIIVCSLFHDAAEKLAPLAHGAVIADILGPFVGERTEWLLRYHPIFQQYHFAAHPSIDRHARESLRSAPHFAYAAHYCATYDENSFDPDFPTLPLERFEPIVAAFFEPYASRATLRMP